MHCKKCSRCQSIISYKTNIRYNKLGEVEKVWLVQECNCLSHNVSLDYAIENGKLHKIGVWK